MHEKETGIIGKLMLQAFGISDPGCVRSNNEDYYLLAPSIGLYVVADGMGGAQAGEHASRLAAETVWEVIYNNAGRATHETLVEAFEEANRRVMAAASVDPSLEGMGTTLAAALDTGEELLLASVGDTRVYRWDGLHLEAITDDQTWVNEVGRRLGMDEEQLRAHPMRHVLTMAIGVSSNLRVHTYQLRPQPGEIVLICSDGLHGVAAELDLVRAMASGGNLEEKAQMMVTAAREAGGPDNITCVLLQAL
jgi:protein phosphatase